jgi:hypothetical protein
MTKAEADRGAAKATEQEEPGMDVFDKEFDTAITEDAKADLTAADKPAVVVEEKPVEKKETLEKPAQKPDEADETDTQRYKTLQGIHKHDKTAWETEKAALLSQLEEAKKPKTVEAEKPAEKKPVEDADLLTEDEKKQLADYEKDFETVTKMEGLKRKLEIARMQKVLDGFIEDVNKRLTEQGSKLTEQGSRLEPVVRQAEITTTAEHFGAIKEAHPDFEKYRDDGSITKWIETQPKYLQPAMKETYESGTAEDVAQLISDFKKANNIQTEANSDSDKIVPINKKKNEKRQALAAVETRRGAVNGSQSIADDFESAFDEALDK